MQEDLQQVYSAEAAADVFVAVAVHRYEYWTEYARARSLDGKVWRAHSDYSPVAALEGRMGD